MKKPLKYTCFDIVLKHVPVYTCIRKVGSTFRPHITTLYTVDATEYVTAQIDATFHEVSEECKTVS